MAEPQIKERLESPEFSTKPTAAVRQRLTNCLKMDAAHIVPDERGDHVKVIQEVLESLRLRFPDLGLLKINDEPGHYGKDTADAVEQYKGINNIVRTGRPLDNIVGRMTITQLDNDLIHGPPPPGPPKDVVIHAPTQIAASDPENLAKDDLTFDLRGPPSLRALDMRGKTTVELQNMMLGDLSKGHPVHGPKLARDFFANTTRPSANSSITHGAGSALSDFVSRTGVWRANSLHFKKQLDAKIKELAANGPVSPTQLRNTVEAPLPSWSPDGKLDAVLKGLSIVGGLRTEDGSMLVLVGSFQASRVFLHEFSTDAGTRSYSGILFYELVDHFGVDTDDTVFDGKGHGTDSQVAFWVLQHERHNPGHMPYRLKIIIRESMGGSF